MVLQNLQEQHFLQSWKSSQQWAKAWLIKNIISAIEKINLSIKVLNGNWEENRNTQVNNTMQDNTGPGDSNNSQATTTPGARPSAGHIVIPYVQSLGGKHQAHMPEIWHKDSLQGQQNPQMHTGQA